MARKVCVFVPAFGGIIRSETVKTIVALCGTLAQKGILVGYTDFSFPDIAEARGIATTIWYDMMPDFDYLLFIDSDMAFDPQLVLDMFLFDEPLIGTVYPQRRVPLGWAGSGCGPVMERRGDFVVMEGVGFGCTLMHRDVIKIMLEQMPQIVDTRIQLHPASEMLKNAGASRLIRAYEKLDIPDRGIISEDLSFCIRWNNCIMPDGTKGKTWAAIGHQMHHIGNFDYQGRYLDVVNQIAAGQMALPPPQQTPVAPVQPVSFAQPARPYEGAEVKVELKSAEPPRYERPVLHGVITEVADAAE